ncbi:MAG: hypothetical protein ACREV6_12920 [Clostridium sp.]|uniref:hypothetical protein n=1 Tax=Clostridium sp. TaxID=1506 RepID=UPI003D6D82A9
MLENKIKQVLAFESTKEAEKYKIMIDNLLIKLEDYIKILEQDYKLINYPKAIVWTTSQLATTVFSNVPIPAYTNDRFICITPDINTWKKIYGDINKDVPNKGNSNYYQNISTNFLLTMIGHEFTHHSDLFLDDFDNNRYSGIWFEEGMCDYLSRKYLLNNEEFECISQVEWDYIMYYKNIFKISSIEEFGVESYSNSMERIMYEYHRSFHTVKKLVEVLGKGDPKKIFALYQIWDSEGRKTPLSKYFGIDIFE